MPSNIVHKTVADLIDFGEVRRVRLGVSMSAIDEKMADDLKLSSLEGVYILEVEKGSSADKAGVKEEDALNGYVLDGFPRTIAQAEALDKVAKIDIAVNIVVGFDVIVERLAGRRVCVCGATYHTSKLNGSTTCAKCGKELFFRDDDKPETVRARLETYEKQTAPLIGYYDEKGILVNVDATGTIEQDFEKIKKVLND